MAAFNFEKYIRNTNLVPEFTTPEKAKVTAFKNLFELKKHGLLAHIFSSKIFFPLILVPSYSEEMTREEVAGRIYGKGIATTTEEAESEADKLIESLDSEDVYLHEGILGMQKTIRGKQTRYVFYHTFPDPND